MTLSFNFIKKSCIMSNPENICLPSEIYCISPKKIVRKLTKENKLLRNVKNIMELILQNKFKF